ncbi:MAG: hypothetical protein K6A65_08445 [Succinivibrionaceae bacterium]|nr:hypothetical protein [Succinivibrionaceae bacterium]
MRITDFGKWARFTLDMEVTRLKSGASGKAAPGVAGKQEGKGQIFANKSYQQAYDAAMARLQGQSDQVSVRGSAGDAAPTYSLKDLRASVQQRIDSAAAGIEGTLQESNARLAALRERLTQLHPKAQGAAGDEGARPDPGAAVQQRLDSAAAVIDEALQKGNERLVALRASLAQLHPQAPGSAAGIIGNGDSGGAAESPSTASATTPAAGDGEDAT